MVDSSNTWSESEGKAIRDQLVLVLDSAMFVHAERLGRFLKFIVDETLAGRTDRLKQFAIAIDVFDRDVSFDPTIDAIVRVEAGRLRSKLLEYYDELGRNDLVRIELPKRSYATTFKFRSKPGASLKPQDEKLVAGSGPIHANRTVSLVEPVIAVLPFVNMSPDVEQEYFAEGVTEDLITDLSQLPGILVISRQSSFTYRDRSATVQQICQDLGANIVLEGSVRKVGDRVRINAQLIEGASGTHLWAERFDRDLENIFEIQDEVNQKVINALNLHLTNEPVVRERKGTDVIDAYDYLLRGMNEGRTNTIEGSARARYCFERALELDPRYAPACARLAFNYIYRWTLSWSKSREDSLDKGFDIAVKAVELDDQLALTHAILGWAHLWKGEHENAIAECNIAVQLDASDVVALERLALSMIWAGDAKPSFPYIEKANRLNPGHSYDFVRGAGLFMLFQYHEAIECLKKHFRINQNFVPAGLYLASSQALAGYTDDAKATIAEIKKVRPDFELTRAGRLQFKNRVDAERYADGLRQAGLS